MKFGLIPIAEADGAILAHAVKQGELVLKKGVALGASELKRLVAAGVSEVFAARLEPGDIDENVAAGLLAQTLAGAGVRVDAPFTGRSNLFAEAAGVLIIPVAAVDGVNAIDESITVATLPNMRSVVAGEMIGTVKIIPFSVREELLAQARAAAAMGAISVAPFRPKRIAVISTLLPGLKPTVVDKTLRVLAERLKIGGGEIVGDRRVPHETAALAEALRETVADLTIVFGASAITDRADVIPAAVEQAGGRVENFGMPVDPGNLLMLGTLHGKPVLGAPGCARSPKENGFDWVLQRLLADMPVGRAEIRKMGVGGLLMEIVSRPQPRGEEPALPVKPLAVIVLAAGRSTRMGGPNKLLALFEGKPLVRHCVENALAAAVGPVLVVTGHQGAEVRAALAGLAVRFVDNPAFATGLASSLKAGVAALDEPTQGAIVMLGDMPLVPPLVLRRLVGVFGEQPEAQAVVPTTLGERGNPVLISRALFPAVAGISGDIGARKLIEAAGIQVAEAAVDDAGIHSDIDTPEALAELKSQKLT